jgi:hypothetical protein
MRKSRFILSVNDMASSICQALDDGHREKNNAGPANELDPREYINLLIRIAAKRYGCMGVDGMNTADGSGRSHHAPSASLGSSGISVAEAFEKLVVDTLLPNSSVADDTEVKNVMGGKVMTKILTIVKPELDEVFKFYKGRNEVGWCRLTLSNPC